MDVLAHLIFLRQLLRHTKVKAVRTFWSQAAVKPFMQYREIEIVEELVRNLQPQKCLEWGAGYSTIYFPTFLGGNSSWVAIEHDENWARRIGRLNRDPRVTVVHIQPDNPSWANGSDDGSFRDFQRYVTFPVQVGEFDFILIDGRARKACLIQAHDLIDQDGVVLLHDANRKGYHPPFQLYQNQLIFRSKAEDSGGVWLGSKARRLGDLIDVEKHRKVWDLYEKFEKVLPF